MATWAFPCTISKAKILKTMLSDGISALDAKNQLFEIKGDDRPFIDLDNLAPNDDAREVIVQRLQELIQSPNYETEIPWEAEALKICEQICQTFAS